MADSAAENTVEALFGLAIRIENQVGDLYREFAKRFAHHPESAALWKALADDEDIHARVLAKALADASPEKLASPAPSDTWDSVTKIMRLLSRVLLEPVESLRDAYELAHQFEHSEVNAVFEFLSVDVVPGNIEREFVRTHITTHQKRLIDFAEKRMGRDWQVTPQ